MSDLLRAASQAIASCRGDRLVASFFGQEEYQSWFQSPWFLIAVGKAAGAMAAGAYPLGRDTLVAGLVVSKNGSNTWLSDARILQYQAAHPVPDASSFDAGEALLDFVVRLPSQARVLFCLSGGASSLVEVLPAGVSHEQWQGMTMQWLASGMSIAQINAHRKSRSQIKGGKLLSHFPSDAQILQLAISDVETNDIHTIGSGLLAADAGNQQLSSYLLASNSHLLAQLAHDLPNLICSDVFVVDSVDVFCQRLVAQAKQGAKGVFAWGGEPVVHLPAHIGRGGRMQHLALLLAWQMRDCSFSWRCLAMGSDGSDGATEDAGALVNQDTIRLAQQAGWDIENTLLAFDSGRLLEDIGVLVTTGDTGTNVNDLVVFRCD